MSLIPILIIVFLSWMYTFWNGANDCANSIATTVSTKALSIRKAILISALFNLIGALISTEVAKTIGKGIVDPNIISFSFLISALVGATIWTVFSTNFGLPISVSHSLIGGLIGCALVKNGFHCLILRGLIKVSLGMILAPVLGFFFAGALSLILAWLINCFSSRAISSKLNNFFRKGQILTTMAVSFSHGMNDSQNAMGLITLSLFTGGFLTTFTVPVWVIVSSGVFMALGTAWGGYKVIKTVGRRIYKILPFHGISCEASSALIVFVQSLFGVPLSTTQVITAGVIGVGAIERKAMVNWRKIIEIIFSWIFTIPGAAFISAGLFTIFQTI